MNATEQSTNVPETTLAGFLLARIAEDEAAAQYEWTRVAGAARRNGKTAARRRLLECEAKRRIVELHPEMLEWCQGCAHESHPCRTLRALAAIYADREGYREEWRL